MGAGGVSEGRVPTELPDCLPLGKQGASVCTPFSLLGRAKDCGMLGICPEKSVQLFKLDWKKEDFLGVGIKSNFLQKSQFCYAIIF